MKELRCPDCESGQIYNRLKDNDFRCSKCGGIFQRKDLKLGKDKL